VRREANPIANKGYGAESLMGARWVNFPPRGLGYERVEKALPWFLLRKAHQLGFVDLLVWLTKEFLLRTPRGGLQYDIPDGRYTVQCTTPKTKLDEWAQHDKGKRTTAEQSNSTRCSCKVEGVLLRNGNEDDRDKCASSWSAIDEDEFNKMRD
jgi:hypothetical protein